CGAHAEDVERGFAETFHQLAGEHLADRAILWRCDPVHRQFRAMHHQLATDLDLGGEPRNPVTNDRIVRRLRRVAVPRHDVPAQLFEGVSYLENDAAADKTTLEGESSRQYFPSAIDLADDILERNTDIVVEDVGEGAVIHRRRGP